MPTGIDRIHQDLLRSICCQILVLVSLRQKLIQSWKVSKGLHFPPTFNLLSFICKFLIFCRC